MVRALLEGRKTQTRRMAWREPRDVTVSESEMAALAKKGWKAIDGADEITTIARPSPWQFVEPGDRLWVREAWKPVPASAYRCSESVQQTANPKDCDEAAVYRAGWCRSTGGTPWRPSIHMPRWASRLTLTVTEARMERLQAIEARDCIAEGIHPIGPEHAMNVPRNEFRDLWNSLHGPNAWAENPEVVVLSFKVESACARS
jgi:hypothetical protein